MDEVLHGIRFLSGEQAEITNTFFHRSIWIQRGTATGQGIEQIAHGHAASSGCAHDVLHHGFLAFGYGDRIGEGFFGQRAQMLLHGDATDGVASGCRPFRDGFFQRFFEKIDRNRIAHRNDQQLRQCSAKGATLHDLRCTSICHHAGCIPPLTKVKKRIKPTRKERAFDETLRKRDHVHNQAMLAASLEHSGHPFLF